MYYGFNSFTDHNKSDTPKSFYYFLFFHIKFRIYCFPFKFTIMYITGVFSILHWLRNESFQKFLLPWRIEMEGLSYTSLFPLSSTTCTFSYNYKNWISKGKVDKVSELLERTDSWSDLLAGWRVKVISFKAYLFKAWQSEKFVWLPGCSSQ